MDVVFAGFALAVVSIRGPPVAVELEDVFLDLASCAGFEFRWLVFVFIVKNLAALATEAFYFPLKAGLIGSSKDFFAWLVGADFNEK